MTIAKQTIHISASPYKVWDAISDFENVKSFHPLVKDSPLLSSEKRGIGAKRRCEFYDKTSVVEEIIQCSEGRSMTVQLSEMSMPLKKAVVILNISPVGDNATEMTMEMNYTVKFGLLGWMMGIFLMRPMMHKMFRTIMKSLEYYIVTGKPVGDGVPNFKEPHMA